MLIPISILFKDMVLDLMDLIMMVVGLVKNVIILGADMSSSVDIDNKKKKTLILNKGPRNGIEVDCRERIFCKFY